MDRRIGKQAWILLIAHQLRGVTGVFLGSFMTIYFLKVTQWNLAAIALFNIIFYLVVAASFVLLGKHIKCGNKVRLYQIGILLFFIFFLLIGLLKEKTGQYIYYLAVLQGIATTFYWFPYNVFAFEFNSSGNRSLYFSYDKVIGDTIGIIVPVIFGTVIVMASYQIAIIIGLIFSGLSFIASLKLSNEGKVNSSLNIKGFVHRLIKDKKSDVFRTYKGEFLRGINYSGALGTVITILIYLSFESEFSLGVVSSFLSIISILVTLFIGWYLKEKLFKQAVIYAGIVLFLGTFILVFSVSQLSVILYNVVLTITLPILSILQTVYTYNAVDKEDLAEYKVEHLILRDIALDFGRISGFILVLIVGFHKMDINMIRILLVILSFSILLISYQTKKFKMSC
jgi:YQGE family putative transporter